MNYEIITRGVMAYIDQIQKLADRHSVTLGFIPAKAYHQFAHDNHLYCAIKDEHVIAYVLFRYNKKTNKIVLVHVCVDDSHTKSGVAKALIELVIQQNPLAHLIEARCRRDYNLDDFWKQCGFHVTNEKPGRSLAGTHLKIWQRKIQTLDMLYLVQKAEAAKKLVAVLDTNIIIELCDDPTGNASCLYEASIADYVTYQITPECLDEISLKADVNSRKKHLEFANRYSCTASSLLDKDLTPSLMERFDPLGSHKADIRHLAHCIDASVDVFVTNDKWICNLRETFRSEYGVDILHPEELYATIEERFDAQAYIAESVVGSQYSEVLLSLEDLKETAELAVEINQKKKDFESWLRSNLTSPNQETILIKQQDRIIGLYVLKEMTNHFELTQFILSNNKVKKNIREILAKAILERIIERIAEKADPCTALILKPEAAVITDHIFLQTSVGGLKIIVNAAMTVSRAMECIAKYIDSLTGVILKANENKTICSVYQAFARQEAIVLEKLLAPIILIDLDIPTWIVPIKPRYAARLFDNKLANMNQSFLHNEHEYAALSAQNSYYTKAKRRFITPCRILWYISYDSRYTGSRAIRACSMMRSVDVGTKKELFSRHDKYGVLSWNEMDTVNAADVIRVFSFDNTRMLNSPISLECLKQLIKSTENKEVQLVSPNLVTNTVACKLIEKGMAKKECIS